jgi:hypothetical protein
LRDGFDHFALGLAIAIRNTDDLAREILNQLANCQPYHHCHHPSLIHTPPIDRMPSHSVIGVPDVQWVAVKSVNSDEPDEGLVVGLPLANRKLAHRKKV